MQLESFREHFHPLIKRKALILDTNSFIETENGDKQVLIDYTTCTLHELMKFDTDIFSISINQAGRIIITERLSGKHDDNLKSSMDITKKEHGELEHATLISFILFLMGIGFALLYREKHLAIINHLIWWWSTSSSF